MPDLKSKGPPVVLLVDDNPSKRYSIGRLLRSADFEVIEAASGQEALDLAESGPDAIVLDVNLPDIDGYEVCRILRSRERTARTPLIHLSATFVDANDKVLGLDAGADGYLTHPVEPPVLIATLKAFLRARQAEERMRQSDARFRAIFQRVPTGIALLDDSLRFVEANPAMARMLGVNAHLLVGRSWAAYAAPDAQQRVTLMERSLRERGEAHEELETVRDDGKRILLDWTVSARSEHGWLACATDSTLQHLHEAERERLLASERAARTDAERANRGKDEFLATISHELRSPLQAIVGWAQLLESGRSQRVEDYQAGVAAIARNARIQARLVSDLLDVSRITSGKLHLVRDRVDLRVAAANAVESVRNAATAKRITLQVDADPGELTVLADPARIHQVLANLLTNAVKFTGEGGRIRVHARGDAEQVEVEISDDGVGISADFLPHVFEHFRQEDAASTRRHEGLGLGLSIVKRLVELHDGSIEARSAGLGQGSAFVIRLPRSALDPSAPATLESRQALAGVGPKAPPRSLRGLRVLIVDDDADARSFVKRLLDEQAALTFEAESASEAWRKIRDHDPQLLISDISMPGEDGFQLIRQVRAAGYDAVRLPAVALTAFAHPEDRVRVLASGFQLHLAKPIELETLLGALTELVGVREVTDPV